MITVLHHKQLTADEVARLNGATGGWDSEPRFSRYADVGLGELEAILEAYACGEYEFAGAVDTDDLESAWLETQHCDFPWTKNGSVIPFGAPRRSSSVGDLFLRGGRVYYVAPVGFEEIPRRRILGALAQGGES